MSMTTRRDESQGSSARHREIDPEVDNHVRKLLTLTIVSGVLYLTTIITNIITGQITHKAFEDAPFGAPPESLYWVGAVVGLILLVGMYMAVYIPLRKRLREGWYAGAVFATVGLIHAALSAVVRRETFSLACPALRWWWSTGSGCSLPSARGCVRGSADPGPRGGGYSGGPTATGRELIHGTGSAIPEAMEHAQSLDTIG